MNSDYPELNNGSSVQKDVIGNIRIGYSKLVETVIFPKEISFIKGEDYVIKTKHGFDIGKAICPSFSQNIALATKKESDELSFSEDYYNIIRSVSSQDLELQKKQASQKQYYKNIVDEKIKHFGLNINIIDIYPFFEGEKIIFTFYSQEKEVDFRSLVKDLGSTLQMRIELHKIYNKDVSEILDGIAVCGRRFCCSTIKCHKKKKNQKSAKENISYNNVSLGSCGKSKCCQSFE